MINRAGNKEKAKRVLNENGNLSGMVGMEILYRVIAAITSVLLGAMIAGGIGVVSAVVSAPFKLFGLAGIIIAYVLITPIATLVGAIAGGAVAGPFEVARYRYYLSLRKNGIRPKVTCIFDAFDFFMQFALVTGVRMLTIMWIPVLIQFATLLLAAVVAAASRSYLAAMLLVMIGIIAALVVAAYRSYQFWPMALVQADHPQLNAEQVMERCKVMTEGHKFDLFVFDLSYLGWNILSLLTGGILSVLYLLNQGIEQLPDGYYNALAGQLASAYIRQAEATGNPSYQKDALRTYQQLEKNGNTTLEVRLNIAMLQYQLHDFSKAMEMLQALKNDYPKDYRVYKWLAFVQGELDLQNGASYTKTLGYYETAAELYRAEQASGVYDPQMDELDRMARNNWQ